MNHLLHRRLREAVSGTATPALQRAGVREDDSEPADTPVEESAAGTKPCTECTSGLRENGELCEACNGTGLREDDEEDSGASLQEALTVQSFRTLLREAKVTKVAGDGDTPPRYEVTLIEEGLGNPDDLNYYTADALREAATAGIFEGLQAYADHPTRSEERDQPERSIRKLVGHYENVRFVEGTVGELRGEFVPIQGEEYEWVPDLIESSLKAAENTGRPLIGISIDGGGATAQVEHDGRYVNEVRRITEVFSADLVTRAGAGGTFHRRLMESLRRLDASRPGSPNDQEDTVTMKSKELQERLKAATAKLREAGTAKADDSNEDAVRNLREAFTELDELATADVDVEIREREVPAPTGDQNVDELTTQLREAQTARDSAIAERDTEKQRADQAEEKVGTFERSVEASKVLREAEVDEKTARRWFPDLVKLDTAEEMKRFVESRKEELDDIESRLRESLLGSSIEGAGARVPSGGTADRDLAGDLGVEADELQPAEAAAE